MTVTFACGDTKAHCHNAHKTAYQRSCKKFKHKKTPPADSVDILEWRYSAVWSHEGVVSVYILDMAKLNISRAVKTEGSG